ncbi:hypothetical protein CsatB_002666 [Cannabis sativa]
MQGKGQPNNLTSLEKLELWDKLKYLSFTRMVLSLWTMTLLSLYIRVQVNILGRHLYIDTSRHIGSIHCLIFDRGNENPYQTTNQSTSSLLPLRFFSGSSPPSLAHHRFLYCHFSLWSLFAFAGGNDVVYSALS